MKTLLISDSENNYRPWRVDYYPNGDRVPKYTNGKPTVAFSDMSYPETFGNAGQFVSEYYFETVIEHKGQLVLDGDKYNREAWTIHGETMAAIMAWLREVAK
jgi:hypothetical protein